MSEERLDNPNVGATVNQVVSTRMTQHVRVDVEIVEAGCFSNLSDHHPYHSARERFAALTHEQRICVGMHFCPFGQPRLDGPSLTVKHRVITRGAGLEALDVQHLFFHVHVGQF